ncbi:MAG: putative major facilitator superfamily transporter, partial [Arthrobacter sp.]|nr:putative major facilitator superfamily transporter [Arthrobacter sp.]
LSVALIVVGYFIRAAVSESPVFKEMVERKRESATPLKQLLRTNKKQVLLAAVIFIGNNAAGPRDRLPVLVRPKDAEDGRIPGAAGNPPRLVRLPASVRYSGIGIGYALGSILGGAFAPLIAEALLKDTGWSVSIGIYIMALCVISFIGVSLVKETKGVPLGADDSNAVEAERVPST